ncbi:hypothetical protein KSD51_07955 [Staphylococcus aureus]|nr:hypothetical protein [Staphylococcus aureus]EZI14645.1 hypothetical protein CO30_1991 [Staphylococcus aureus subsp. aureus CO-30]MBS3468898.1 hypothetical protein [Staphylococcus aureus]MBS3489790.1 hypothetical protein [Staphylococcus aureus]MBS3514459.1 hypothetical protein [Staphylococcus aureus]MBU4979285.1 hypothetical protein [Staphylococcus aureus]
MRWVNRLLAVFMGLIFVYLGFKNFNNTCKMQNEIFSQFVTINITLISILIALTGILAAIRNLDYINEYLHNSGEKFKIVYILSLLTGSISILLFFLMISSIPIYNREVTYIISFITEGTFLVSSYLIIWNMFDMIFENKGNKTKREFKNVFKDAD